MLGVEKILFRIVQEKQRKVHSLLLVSLFVCLFFRLMPLVSNSKGKIIALSIRLQKIRVRLTVKPIYLNIRALARAHLFRTDPSDYMSVILYFTSSKRLQKCYQPQNLYFHLPKSHPSDGHGAKQT